MSIAPLVGLRLGLRPSLKVGVGSLLLEDGQVASGGAPPPVTLVSISDSPSPAVQYGR